MATIEPTIPEYFAGKNVFVTGASGFMGKVLVEKLLRSCPDVNNIYVLIRPKKGSSSDERWDAISNLPLFDKLRATMPKQLEKVKVVEGDINSSDLGLSEQNKQELIENVNFVYHSAAAVQFTEDLLYSFRENTYGTYLIAELAKSMKKLESFIHVSTAYSNCNRPDFDVLEEIYPLNLDWKAMLELMKTDPITLTTLKDKIMCGHPTTYTLTKGLAEQVMSDYSKYYRVIVIRPSLVISTVNDPMEGWVDVLNGLSSLIIATGAGILRICVGRDDSHLDFVSVDHAIKCFIVATWLEGKKKLKSGVEVVNCNYSSDMYLKMKEITSECHKFVAIYPLDKCLWCPSTTFVENKFLYFILFFFFQIIPAVVVDTAFRLKGMEPIVMKYTIKIAQAFNGPISFFSTKRFSFPNYKFKKMVNELCEKDKTDFHYDTKDLSSRELVWINAIGTYKYTLKQKMDEKFLNVLRKKYQRLLYLHYAVCSFLCFTAGYATLSIAKFTWSLIV